MKILFMSTERIIRASLFVDLVQFDLKNARDSKTGKRICAFRKLVSRNCENSERISIRKKAFPVGNKHVVHAVLQYTP